MISFYSLRAITMNSFNPAGWIRTAASGSSLDADDANQADVRQTVHWRCWALNLSDLSVTADTDTACTLIDG